MTPSARLRREVRFSGPVMRRKSPHRAGAPSVEVAHGSHTIVERRRLTGAASGDDERICETALDGVFRLVRDGGMSQTLTVFHVNVRPDRDVASELIFKPQRRGRLSFDDALIRCSCANMDVHRG